MRCHVLAWRLHANGSKMGSRLCWSCPEVGQSLVFRVQPVLDDQVWDGNAFNVQEEWDYRYENINGTTVLDGLEFINTVDVIQRDISNLVETEFAKEIYAKDIGMIFKQIDTFQANFPDQDTVKLGVLMKMTAFDHGIE